MTDLQAAAWLVWAIFVSRNTAPCLLGPAPVIPADGACCFTVDYTRDGFVDLRDVAAFSNDLPTLEAFAGRVRFPDCTLDGYQCRGSTGYPCDWNKPVPSVSLEFGACPMVSGTDR